MSFSIGRRKSNDKGEGLKRRTDNIGTVKETADSLCKMFDVMFEEFKSAQSRNPKPLR